MSLPHTDTVVTYPAGDVSSSGTVVHVESLPDGRTAIVLDRTAFHAIDPVWPDQPADAGTIEIGGRVRPVVDAVVGATDGAVLHVGDAPVRTGTEGWSFVVCHLVDDADGVAEGAAAAVEVDPAVRRALSAGHTACHLASLALNEALAPLWTKEVPGDGRGRPDFDRLAIVSSRILPNGSRDEYRVGKSLRKKGFAAAELPGRVEEVVAVANALLAEWIASGAAVTIRRDGDGLGDRRFWTCDLPGGAASIPCGGTHLRTLADLSAVEIALDVEEAEGALGIAMRTTATPA